MDDLLLHSLSEFDSILLPVLDAVKAQITVELGVEHGTLSARLIERAKRIGGMHIGIDPLPDTEAVRLFDNVHAFIVTKTSVAALEALDIRDAYLIDGDHNYYTVAEELRLIDAAAKKADRQFPLVILHDIGWPCGRRDMYYNPAALPENTIHPHTFELGVTLDNAGMIPGGFRGEKHFAFARHEGGPKNGVRTALEDFMHGRNDLAFYDIPAIFGLGIVIDAQDTQLVRPLLEPYHNSSLLYKLERNRLKLFLKVLELQDLLAAMQQSSNSIKAASR